VLFRYEGPVTPVFEEGKIVVVVFIPEKPRILSSPFSYNM